MEPGCSIERKDLSRMEKCGEKMLRCKWIARGIKKSPVRLRRKEREIVREAILEAAKRFKQNIRAIAVCSNHVHIVCEYVEVPIGVLVGYYKNAGRKALKKSGYEGRVWTRGYDKRFCFDQKALRERMKYVEGHR